MTAPPADFTFDQWREDLERNLHAQLSDMEGATRTAIFTRWYDALCEAYSLARADRIREIKGDRRVKAFDAQGLHPFSRAWGVVQACEDFLPGLSVLRCPQEGVVLEAWVLRRLAARDANERAAVALATQDPQDWWS